MHAIPLYCVKMGRDPKARVKKGKGRPPGGKNKKGHKAGRPSSSKSNPSGQLNLHNFLGRNQSDLESQEQNKEGDAQREEVVDL